MSGLQSIGEILGNMDFNISEPQETGENCKECGRPLMIRKTNIGIGIIHLDCECVVARREAEERAIKEQQRKELIKRLFSKSNLPPKERRCNFENFRKRNDSTAKGLAICRRYVEKFGELRRTGKGMFIYGNTGSGKTHLSAAVANALIEQGCAVRFQDVNQLYYWIKSTYRKGSEENESDYIQPCIDASLLILDDLGAETPTDWTMATMHHIINSRIDALRPTIITSNLKPADLGNALSVRTVNRILDTADRPFEMVSIVCESYRTSGGE